MSDDLLNSEDVGKLLGITQNSVVYRSNYSLIFPPPKKAKPSTNGIRKHWLKDDIIKYIALESAVKQEMQKGKTRLQAEKEILKSNGYKTKDKKEIYIDWITQYPCCLFLGYQYKGKL